MYKLKILKKNFVVEINILGSYGHISPYVRVNKKVNYLSPHHFNNPPLNLYSQDIYIKNTNVAVQQ
jgi:hypothetical protein